MKRSGISAASMVLCICLAGCTSKSANTNLSGDQSHAKDMLDSQRKAAAQTAQSYHAMDNPALLAKLVDQSKAQREPFNSMAYRELKTRNNVDPNAVAVLVKDNANAGGLLPLLLLRKLDNQAYLAVPVETRATILTEALRDAKHFNTWGLPNFYLEDASNALIETGKSAVPALQRMLLDTRPAPVFGSQEYMLYQQYKYRVCDYALFFLERIKGNAAFRMPVSPEERDGLIKRESTK